MNKLNTRKPVLFPEVKIFLILATRGVGVLVRFKEETFDYSWKALILRIFCSLHKAKI
jgi:hypothetical protein